MKLMLSQNARFVNVICYVWWTCFHRATCFIIRKRQISYRGFSRKTKRSQPDPLILHSAISMMSFHLSNTTGFTSVAGTLNIFPEHLNSPPVFSEVRVARSFVFCVVFCRSLFIICPFSFGHCVKV